MQPKRGKVETPKEVRDFTKVKPIPPRGVATPQSTAAMSQRIAEAKKKLQAAGAPKKTSGSTKGGGGGTKATKHYMT